VRINAAKDGFVRAEQLPPRPEVLEGVIEILKLDPVLAGALKPNSKDSQLHKLQKEVCFALGVYLAKIQTLLEMGKWNPQEFAETIRVSVSFSKNLLELMEKPEDKLKCYELEVRLLESIYKFTDTRVIVGTDPSQNRDFARAAWLEAEVKLLKLKLEIEKGRK
jgi:predicted urease superfamily metal-dependent hydrolase